MKGKYSKTIYKEGFAYPFITAFFTPFLRPRLLKCLYSIFKNFFLDQHIAAILPGKIKVKKVDHELDKKIPFRPKWMPIYLDFVFFWTRTVSFFFKRYGKKGYKRVGAFIESIGDLYATASKVYKKCLSTTERPFYIARPKFLLIHMLDPHLMCVPSLHVMIVIYAYTQFKEIAKENNDEENLKEIIKEMEQGSLAITQAVLFVKQHSVNCIPAALYAMTRYSPELFPKEEAYRFIENLFTEKCAHPFASPKMEISEEDKKEIREYIISMYNRFLEEGRTAGSWEEPILDFLSKF